MNKNSLFGMEQHHFGQRRPKTRRQLISIGGFLPFYLPFYLPFLSSLFIFPFIFSSSPYLLPAVLILTFNSFRIHSRGTIWHAAAFLRPDDFERVVSKKMKEYEDKSKGYTKATWVPLIREIEYCESLLHIACLYSNFEVASHLIKEYGTNDLLNAQYQGPYKGLISKIFNESKQARKKSSFSFYSLSSFLFLFLFLFLFKR